MYIRCGVSLWKRFFFSIPDKYLRVQCQFNCRIKSESFETQTSTYYMLVQFIWRIMLSILDTYIGTNPFLQRTFITLNSVQYWYPLIMEVVKQLKTANMSLLKLKLCYFLYSFGKQYYCYLLYTSIRVSLFKFNHWYSLVCHAALHFGDADSNHLVSWFGCRFCLESCGFSLRISNKR